MKPLPLLALAGLLACARPPEEAKTPPPELTLYGVTMTSWRGSALASEGTARELVYERTSGDAQARDAQVRLPSSDAGERYVLSAPVLTGNVPERQADGEGGVVLTGDRGLVARTARAHFDGVRMIATGTDPVRVDAPAYSIEAGGFLFDVRQQDLTFTAPVRSTFGGER